MNIKKILSFIILITLSIFTLTGQEFKKYNFEEFEQYLFQSDHKIYVINFWATWCKPCVEEMPAFNKLHEKYHTKNVEIILVSLDFGKNLDQRINNFKTKHKIKSKIIILDDPDSNSWINKVDKSWSGAIPATMIYRKNKRKFYEKSFSFPELEKEIQNFN